MSGAFITLEGSEGVGKSTLRDRVHEFIAARGHTVVVTREPGGTPLGEQIRTWLLDSEHAHVSAEVEALLMFAARGYHLDNVIRPALSEGTWVLCDRFTDATLAYQGGGRRLSSDFLRLLKSAVQGATEPDLTLLLDAPVEIGLQRIADRSADHFEREDVAFFERVRAAYRRLAEEHPDRIRVVDASLSADAVWAQAQAVLTEFATRFEQRTTAGERHG